MAIKGSASITLSFMVDVKATYRYYKLQSSTAAKPSIPTTADTTSGTAPSGWTDTEPTYTSGSTNTLYFVDLTVFANDTFSYTPVSKSSSYEAAKEAYNKAVAASNTANTANNTANSVKDDIANRDNQYGLKYKTNVTVYGESNKFYPVIIKYGNQNVKRTILVYRGYSEQAPADWNTSTHKGGLTLKLRTNFGGWGGANYSWIVDEFEEMYSQMFGGAINCGANTQFALFLRGGGETGAIYHLYSDQSLTATGSYDYVPEDDGTFTINGLPSPQIAYNSDLCFCTSNGSHKYYAPAPRAMVTGYGGSDSKYKRADAQEEEIRIRNYVVISKTAVEQVDVEYYLSTSQTSLSGGSWSTTAPTWVNGKYMWSRTKTTLQNGTTSYKPSSNGICIAGAKGDTGATGKGIASITEEYYLSTSKTTQTGGSWSATPPTWSAGKYIWTRSKIVYSNPSSTEYTTPICDSSWEAANDVYDKVKEELTTLENKYNETVQTVEGNTTSIGNIQTTVNTLTGEVTEMESSMLEIKETAEGVETVVTQNKGKWDNAASSVDVIVGAQTAATNVWTGTASFSSLTDGQQITYWLPYDGNSSSATLNLTLSNGTTTGAIPCYYGNTSRITTHYKAGNVIRLLYRENVKIGSSTIAKGWWADANYDSNTYDRIRFNNSITAKTAITASRLIVGDDSGFFHLAANTAFDITKPILYAGSAITASSTGSNNYLAYPSINLRNNLSGVTLTKNKTCYIVGSVANNKFTPNSTLFTSTEPTSEDGLVYIALGLMISTYQIYLYPEHPIYKYVDGGFKSSGQIAYEAQSTATNAQTIANQTANKFQWIVKSGTSATDFTLTDRTATLVAEQINLKGLVTFNGLNSETQGKINNGDDAKTTVDSWSNDEIVGGTTTINGGYLKTNSIDVDKLNVENIFANSAWIDHLNSIKIKAEQIEAGLIKSNMLDIYGLVVRQKDTDVETLAIDTKGDITMRGSIESYNYNSGVSGWSIKSNGDAEFNDVTVRGDLIGSYGGIMGMNVANLLEKSMIVTYSSASSNETMNTSSWANNGKITYSRIATANLGFYINNKNIMKPNTDYVVSFKAKVTSGSITKCQFYKAINHANTNVYFDGVRKASAGEDFSVSMSDGQYHEFVFKFKTANSVANSSGSYLGDILQFNKSVQTAFTVEMIELMWEERPEPSGQWCLALADSGKEIVFWAGESYDQREYAPYRVYSDGSVLSTKGTFSGLWTGEIEIGNISIIDPSKTSGNDAILTIQHGETGVKRVQLRDTDESTFAQNIIIQNTTGTNKILLVNDGSIDVANQYTVGETAIKDKNIYLGKAVFQGGDSAAAILAPDFVTIGDGSTPTNLNVYGNEIVNGNITASKNLIFTNGWAIMQNSLGIDISINES